MANRLLDISNRSFTYGLSTRGGTSSAPVFYSTGSALNAVGVHHGATSLSGGVLTHLPPRLPLDG